MKKKGFTLVELLVVIAVVGVMMTAVIVVLNPAHFLADSRDTRRKSDLAAIQPALEMYYAEQHSYPNTGGLTFGAVWTPYLKMTPQETKPSPYPSYCYEKVGSGYKLCAQMEGTDASWEDDTCNPGSGNVTYKYCITNPY